MTKYGLVGDGRFRPIPRTQRGALRAAGALSMASPKSETQQRILEIAANIFVWHRLEDVSMGTIA
jgi:hypothetical protein